MLGYRAVGSPDYFTHQFWDRHSPQELLRRVGNQATIDNNEAGSPEVCKMDLQQILRGVDLFEGLTDQELERVVKICNERRFSPGEMITKEGPRAMNFLSSQKAS